MRRLNCLPVWVALACAVPVAHAQSEVYKCLDSAGRPRYTNVKKDALARNCRRVTREISVVPTSAIPSVPAPSRTASRSGSPAPNAVSTSASSFPRVDPATQKARDQERKQILLDEMRKEEAALADAKAKYVAEQSRTPDGTGGASVDRLLAQREAVERHERNIASIQREIASLK